MFKLMKLCGIPWSRPRVEAFCKSSDTDEITVQDIVKFLSTPGDLADPRHTQAPHVLRTGPSLCQRCVPLPLVESSFLLESSGIVCLCAGGGVEWSTWDRVCVCVCVCVRVVVVGGASLRLKRV